MNVMKKIKFYTALAGAKMINSGLHITGHAGTSLPGVVALKIQNEFISNLAKFCRKNIITVTGTNGKTTTAGIVAHILKTAKNSVLHNEKGANMLSGVASSLAVNYKPFTKFDYAVLESDEAYLTKLYDYLQADYLLVTNLFRDQLDRYGELDTTAKKIQEAISKNQHLKVILNADDPMVAGLAQENERIYFGFDEIVYRDNVSESNSPSESVACKCKSELSYVNRYYAHLGNYYCKHCGYKRPVLDYSGICEICSDGSNLVIKRNDKTYQFKTSLVGLYNAYNVLAAVSVVLEYGINAETIQLALDSYRSVFGRAERFSIDNKQVLVQLIKNPTGASEVLRTINQSSALLIIINDNYADGRDVSWLWDTDFEILSEYDSDIVVSGIRADDMALRLKYAGINPEKIITVYDIRSAINFSLNNVSEIEQLIIMPTYTALLEMQQVLNGKKKN